MKRNAKALAEYREWFQIGFSQAAAHMFAVDEATQTGLQSLAAAAELSPELSPTGQELKRAVRLSVPVTGLPAIRLTDQDHAAGPVDLLKVPCSPRPPASAQCPPSAAGLSEGRGARHAS